MNVRSSSAPAWLFSFVDLAFLLLIAMTQLGSRDAAPDLGELLVPRIHSDTEHALPVDAAQRWQLRVHPRLNAGDAPFELVSDRSERTSVLTQADSGRMQLEELRVRLAELRSGHGSPPLLAPHRESRSEDLLEAATALEALWPKRRRATVAPLLALQ